MLAGAPSQVTAAQGAARRGARHFASSAASTCVNGC